MRGTRRTMKTRNHLSAPGRDPHGDRHDHDLGLAHDLRTLSAMRDRRQALRLFAGASLLPLIGCGTDDGTSGLGGDAASGLDARAGFDTSATGSCSVVPEETAGPYPGDGSNGANALTLSGIVRSDIRSSLSPASGTAEGVLLTVRMTLVNTAAGCSPLAGRAIYLWHCDRAGDYSMYTLTTENYLRGVQQTDANGQVTFTSVFPGCYAGRWPHAHFEVYPSVASASIWSGKVRTSQLAFPEDVCNAVYATTGYSQSVTNLRGITLATDGIFRDGATLQMATMSGSVDAGLVATLTVGISA
jgi:protocatechuate 3,4-dioxygenase beta subunit